jgi:O-antigen/teichoic acid export membrane protein
VKRPDAGPRPLKPSRFGRNVLYSSLSWLVPAVVAIIAVPITVRGLGADGYGVIALVGAISGYLGLLDLGLGRGIVRFIAMFVSRGHGRTTRDCLRVVLAWFAGVGVFGAVAMWALAPWLAGSFLKVPPGLVPVTTVAFRIGGLAFALGMLGSVLSLLPQSFLRYDLNAVVNAVLSSVSLAGPAVLVSLGYGILPIVWFSVFTNALACAAWGAVGLRLVGSLPKEGPPFAEHRREFIRFSSAVAANSIWTAIQNETSKVVVGVAGGTTQTAYFQVPNLISSRISGLLSSMSTVLLPTGSQLVAAGEHDQLVSLYERSSRLFFLLNASMTGAVVVFAAPLLTTWVGPQYGKTGGLAFTALALAACLNATSMAASHLNMAKGRPKVNLAFSLINSFINLATVYFFTVWWGISGTAASGLLAATVVPFFLHYSHRKVLGVSSWRIFIRCYARIALAVSLVAAVSWLTLRQYASNLPITLGLLILVGAAGLLASAALGAFRPEDWASLRSIVRRSRTDAGNGAKEGRGDEDDE